MSRWSRRQFVGSMSMAAGLGLTACHSRLLLHPQFVDYPFQLGVASGDPDKEGFVIWTRLAPQPLDGGGMATTTIPVRWEVAVDEKMGRVIRSGESLAEPAWGHSVHVELSGLPAGRDYYYRFYTGSEASPVGRSKTLPADPEQLRIAIASCQHFERGFFSAYRHIIDDQPDLLLFAGDYIYETPNKRKLRQYVAGEPLTLDDYRIRYAEYRLDPDLQEAHRLMPWVMNWDDHEVDNDYAGLHGQDFQPVLEFARRRRAAYQAFYEHLPLRAAARPQGNLMQLYRQLDFGSLGRMLVLDGRQYRHPQACRAQAKRDGRLLGPDCRERLEPNRSYLGAQQETWLRSRLDEASSGWTMLAGPQLVTPFRQRKDGQLAYWNDDWNGYPAARRHLLNDLQASRASDPVFLSGDMHSFWANQVPSDPDQLDSRPVAAEFVTTSLTANGLPYDLFTSLLPDNPQVHYFESRKRGYTLCNINPQRFHTEFVAIDEQLPVNTSRQSLAGFEVLPGQPWPVRV